MADLSILIPARNEQFLKRTVDDILAHMEGDTEINVVLDGCWADPPLETHPKVNVIHYPISIGQRAAQNRAAAISQARWVMKADAHCTFDQGFDVKMMEAMEGHDDWTMVPIMRNLHAFDWVCKGCSNRTYQGPAPEKCEKCGGMDFEMDVVWQAKPSPNSTSYRFDRDLRFKYFGEYKSRQKGDLVDTMSLQGSCFMSTRERYFTLPLCDESWGSWGQQGSEVALKTWLSGGRVVCNKRTWYAHLFRTQKGFSWPYPAPGRSQRNAIKTCKDIFLNDQWPKATRTLQWLVDKFSPVPDWHDSKAIVYYTDNRLDQNLLKACQDQLRRAAGDIPIICISLKPMDFGDVNIMLEEERGYLTLFKQILAGLESTNADVVFFAEHDVLYHPTHFQFVPASADTYYYNENVWKVRVEDGHALHYWVNQTSGLCAYRQLLLNHYQERVKRTEAKLAELGNTRQYRNFIRKQGFEPGTHNRSERVDDYKHQTWRSEFPNIDLRHQYNLTPSRWRKDQFRSQRYTKGWEESNEVPAWGVTEGRMQEFLNGLG